MFIDVHCHLDLLEDFDKLVESAKKKNVLIVSDGVDSLTNRKVLELSEKYGNVEACLGIYPDEALKMSDKEIQDELEFIRSSKEKIVGIGEIGMDFKKSREDEEKQKEIFEKLVLLSIEIDKPVIVHSRKAEEECIELLEELKAQKVLMHCFSGKKKFVERIIKNKWFLSIPISVKNSEHFQNIIKLCPLEQLLCETDSPFLHPDREFPNKPENVIESYKKIAEIKNLDVKEVEKKVEDNFKRFFSYK